jgi:hypothetical protein
MVKYDNSKFDIFFAEMPYPDPQSLEQNIFVMAESRYKYFWQC